MIDPHLPIDHSIKIKDDCFAESIDGCFAASTYLESLEEENRQLQEVVRGLRRKICDTFLQRSRLQSQVRGLKHRINQLSGEVYAARNNNR